MSPQPMLSAALRACVACVPAMAVSHGTDLKAPTPFVRGDAPCFAHRGLVAGIRVLVRAIFFAAAAPHAAAATALRPRAA